MVDGSSPSKRDLFNCKSSTLSLTRKMDKMKYMNCSARKSTDDVLLQLPFRITVRYYYFSSLSDAFSVCMLVCLYRCVLRIS